MDNKAVKNRMYLFSNHYKPTYCLVNWTSYTNNIAQANGLVENNTVCKFGSDGKMTETYAYEEAPATANRAGNASGTGDLFEGAVHCPDGKIHYFKNGAQINTSNKVNGGYKNFIKSNEASDNDTDGYYWYYVSDAEPNIGCALFNKFFLMGSTGSIHPPAMPSYTKCWIELDAEGHFVLDAEKNGAVKDWDGKIRFYTNGITSAKGWYLDEEDGHIYYFGSNQIACQSTSPDTIATETTTSSGTLSDGTVLEAGTYYFDCNGWLIDESELTGEEEISINTASDEDMEESIIIEEE